MCVAVVVDVVGVVDHDQNQLAAFPYIALAFCSSSSQGAASLLSVPKKIHLFWKWVYCVIKGKHGSFFCSQVYVLDNYIFLTGIRRNLLGILGL